METFKADTETMNALINAFGGLVLALANRMPPAQRADFANDLAMFAKNAESRGATIEETLMLDLYRAVTA